MEIKPIETYYNGYRFRSRLEARWAVFFSEIGIRYLYEPQGFDLNGVMYLPDFYLPDLKVFVEVKGIMSDYDKLKIARFATAMDGNEYRGLIVVGEMPLNAWDMNAEWYGFTRKEDKDSESDYDFYWDDNYKFCYCPECHKISIEFEGRGDRVCYHDRVAYERDGGQETAHSPLFNEAYKKARYARFEHGEQP